MIPRERLINKLRELGFTFDRQADRVELYKKKGDTQRVTVRRKDCLAEETVKQTLAQCGMSAADILSFMGQCKN